MGLLDKPAVSPAYLLLLLVMVLVLGSSCKSRIQGRPLPFLPHDHEQAGYWKQIMATLGVVCKCCDGTAAGGENGCTASWAGGGSCSNLQCHPWKLHH